MEGKQKRRSRGWLALWLTAVFLAALVAYPLGIGPAYWAWSHGYISHHLLAGVRAAYQDNQQVPTLGASRKRQLHGLVVRTDTCQPSPAIRRPA
jgi:hypothetical protein